MVILHDKALNVVPTPVGVFPSPGWKYFLIRSRPHARGGVSSITGDHVCNIKSSPRPWGCFQTQTAYANTRQVVPTPVGVFLIKALIKGGDVSRPHARGGVSLC